MIMREIKFRAYDYDNKRFEYDVQYNYDYELGSSFLDILEDNNFLVEQYTGIKDMNDVEVYEGDIIKFHVVMLSPDDKVGYVKYYPEYGYSIMLNRGSLLRQEYWASGDKHTIEVIGNIHEDEELL